MRNTTTTSVNTHVRSVNGGIVEWVRGTCHNCSWETEFNIIVLEAIRSLNSHCQDWHDDDEPTIHVLVDQDDRFGRVQRF